MISGRIALLVDAPYVAGPLSARRVCDYVLGVWPCDRLTPLKIDP
jgi:hypothetical protein